MQARQAELGQIVRYQERIMEVIALGDGRTVTLADVNEKACPACGIIPRVHILEGCRIWDTEVKPVKTLGRDK